MSALGSPVKGGTKAPAQSSASQNTATGSGSRPGGKSSHPIATTAPSDPRTLDRSPPAWLK
jgi:hypothetical protein